MCSDDGCSFGLSYPYLSSFYRIFEDKRLDEKNNIVVRKKRHHPHIYRAVPFLFYAFCASSDARMNSRISGCGRVGRDENCGWNCVPMKNG